MVSWWRYLIGALLLLTTECAAKEPDSFKGPQPSSFVELGSRNGDDVVNLGFSKSLDASLNRISTKLNNEKMHKLLSIDDDESIFGLPSFKQLLQDDEVTKEARQAVRSVETIVPKAESKPQMPRLQQVENTQTAGQKANERLDMKSKLNALAMKQKAMQQEIEELKVLVTQQESTNENRLDKMRQEIISDITKKLSRAKDLTQTPDSQPFQPNRFVQRHQTSSNIQGMDAQSEYQKNIETKRNVLHALQKTLKLLKQRGTDQLTADEAATNPPRADAEVVSPVRSLRKRVMRQRQGDDGYDDDNVGMQYTDEDDYGNFL